MLNNVIRSDWRDLMPKIESRSVDLLLCDPPYGMSYQSNHRAKKHAKIKGDEWLAEWLAECARVLKDDAHAYIFCSWHNVDVFKIEISRHFKIKNILIWQKPNGGMGDLSGAYAGQYEFIIFATNGSKMLNGGRDRDIIKAPITLNNDHPTQKPVELLKYLISKSTNPGDLVLDTFAGSFSTAQAATATGRNWICCEIDEVYCKVGRKLLLGTAKELF